MPIPDEYRNLWSLLENSTRDPSLWWSESGRDGEFVARVGSYSVMVSINRLTEMFSAPTKIQSPVTVQWLLPEGLEIGRFEVRSDDPDYQQVRKYYDRITQGALKKADILRDIEKQLRTAG